jgi:hypothetical protein
MLSLLPTGVRRFIIVIRCPPRAIRRVQAMNWQTRQRRGLKKLKTVIPA